MKIQMSLFRGGIFQKEKPKKKKYRKIILINKEDD